MLMLSLKKDVEILLKIKLEGTGELLKIHHTDLVQIIDNDYLCCWSTNEPNSTNFLHHLQVIRKSSGTILFSNEQIPPMKGQFPLLTSLQKDLLEDFIGDNIEKLTRMANDIVCQEMKQLINNWSAGLDFFSLKFGIDTDTLCPTQLHF